MNAKQSERLVVSFEKIASSLGSFAKIQEKRFKLEFPVETEPQPAEVFHRGDSKPPEPQTVEEYRDFPSDQPGKYETLIRQQNPKIRRIKKN